jgi:2,3,4,5-tetrahydropyridine-2-carboxylate N-succinyltransferase
MSKASMNMSNHMTEDTVIPDRISSYGLATVAADGTPLDIWFPTPRLEASVHQRESIEVSLDEFGRALGETIALLAGQDPVRNIQRIPMRVTSIIDEPPADLYDVYLRLHLISHRLLRPRRTNLEGLLTLLNHDVAWTSRGPCAVSELERTRLRSQLEGHYLQVRSTFCVPPMLDYVSPSDVRIADSNRVLLGSHLAPGTVVSAEGFCGANAGTLGPCMVEGRINAGVVVSGGSHVGGGASLMGTTAGGNRHVVTIGARCLIGANGGTSISLGDDCVIEAGCYVTGGSPVAQSNGQEVKAIELAGRSSLTYRRNARTGRIEAVERSKLWGGLTAPLHPTALAKEAVNGLA